MTDEEWEQYRLYTEALHRRAQDERPSRAAARLDDLPPGGSALTALPLKTVLDWLDSGHPGKVYSPSPGVLLIILDPPTP
jgi:hypothetical protein